MNNTTCQVQDCGRPTQEVLCGHHRTELVTILREMNSGGVRRVRVHKVPRRGEVQVIEEHPGLLAELGMTRAKQNRIGGPSVGGKSREPSLPFNVAAAELRDTAATTVLAWYREFVRLYPHLQQLPGTTTLAETCAWMTAFPSLLGMMPEAARMVDEFTWLAKEIRRVIDAPAPRIFIGTCSASTDEGECQDDLYVVQGRKFMTCHACGTEHDVAARREQLLAALQYQHATLRDMAQGLPELLGRPLSLESLRTWAKAGQLTPVGVNYKGHPTYRVGQVITVALSKKTRTRRPSTVAQTITAA